ncbi:MAG: hypothetical protein PGN37_01150 [Mycobacterium kyogaense]|uniref:hypothetical protein n=1 Tax=Mycobacterium kyogaense TaxID=2212479 RepID=UPI002FFB553C
MDWRATTTETAQADLDQLLADSIQVAIRGLSHQNLAPFMLVISTTGDRGMRSLATPAPNLETAIAALQSDQDAADLRARATVLDVTVREPFAGDAINVRLEHRDGPAIDILVPYSHNSDGITVTTDALTAATDEHRLWPTPPGTEG